MVGIAREPSRLRQFFIARHMTLALSCGVLFFTGCGGGPEMAPVSGRVTASGRPVVRGTILFVPVGGDRDSTMAATGNIEADGTYALRSGRDTEGAACGSYRVAIQGRSVSDPEGMPPNRQIHARYNNAESSGLTAEVKPGTNEINFDLKP